MLYITKPTIIEAIQWTGDNLDEIKKFAHPYEDRVMVENKASGELHAMVGRDGAVGWRIVSEGGWLWRPTKVDDEGVEPQRYLWNMGAEHFDYEEFHPGEDEARAVFENAGYDPEQVDKLMALYVAESSV